MIHFRLWQEVGYSVPEPLCSALLEDVVHDVEVIRKAAAPALAAAVTEHPDVAPSILQQLVDLYDVKLKVRIWIGSTVSIFYHHKLCIKRSKLSSEINRYSLWVHKFEI